MQIIPLIKMKNKKIFSSDEFFKSIDEEQILYIYDFDGIEKDKPNLSTFQKLSKKYELWLDFGPRNLGDVVDSFMAGASSIKIRKNLFPQIDLSKIKEISENKIYLDITLIDQKLDNLFLKDVEGVTNFKSKEEINQIFRYQEMLRQYATKKTVYTYESNKDNIYFWNNNGIKNFLVDIDKYVEMKKAWSQMQKK